MQHGLIAPGEVWLVGAGPGDPDLLTRKAERLIRAADTIFYDALVSKEILEIAGPNARLVAVGKRSGRHSKEQGSINEMLVAEARTQARIVRLKGGDPSIFGRSGEELAFLGAHGVRVRVCPGITAASAAAASARVSLTLRGLSRRLELITAHVRSGEDLDLDWARIASADATICVYMGKAAAPLVARKLIAAGLSGSIPALVVENASLTDERLFSTRLDLLPLAVRTAIGDGPAILLIGEALRSSGVSEQKFADQALCA